MKESTIIAIACCLLLVGGAIFFYASLFRADFNFYKSELKTKGLIDDNYYNASVGFVGFSNSFSTATGTSSSGGGFGGAGGGGVGGGGGGGR